MILIYDFDVMIYDFEPYIIEKKKKTARRNEYKQEFSARVNPSGNVK